ncbi:PREDICTED: neuronal acetylcholine receptor subunit alpha-9-I-like [Nanorana parkeri]|uniref:neuronal acetylcholine receptor subunit alpha-9-I-like n=1 Tax=Nanorana parkeri TaxID=125878 RepID=UPI000853F28B|nr:PREDICTED: neuronal acetylcholine receptor subunit alpha-9-I-like [Nanorana parkeri]
MWVQDRGDDGCSSSSGVILFYWLTVAPLLAGKYYIATMTMITASTALTIFIMNIHHCGPEAKPVPRWAKKFILQYMSRIFFVYEVGESCRRPQTEPEGPPKGTAINGQAKWEEPVATGQKKCPYSGSNTKMAKEELDWGCEDDHKAWREAAGKYERSDHGKGGKGCRSHCLCHNERLLKNVEYMANCFREQRSAQKRTGEWKKVAKVMDRFFMWVFFIMVFFMSMLIMGKAI